MYHSEKKKIAIATAGSEGFLNIMPSKLTVQYTLLAYSTLGMYHYQC
jgi:hypothetical protein